MSKKNKSEDKVTPGEEPSGGNDPELPDTIPNPNFYFGTKTFRLENNDIFDGAYGCHKSGIIWREGWGVYETKDGHMYQGKWENDQLLDSPETAILYPNGHRYFGSVKDGKYCGKGIYIFDNNLILTSEFKDNKPTGTVNIEDYEGHLWQGQAYDSHAIILYTNHFYHTLSKNKGRGQLVRLGRDSLKVKFAATPSLESESELKYQVFKKSSKTKNDFRMSDVTIKESREEIPQSRVAKKSTELFMGERTPISTESKVSVTLLKTFLSRSFRNKCIPIPVYTANPIELPEPEEKIITAEKLNSDETF